MTLTGPQLKQLQEALVSAYTEFGLRQMLRVQMDVDLNRVAGGSNLSELTFSLIQWAERHGQVQRLIEAAYEGNQENPKLGTLVAEAGSWFADQSESPQLPEDVSPATPQAPHQVFLSYSRKDTDQMQEVQRALTDAGLTVWTDEGLAVGTSSWQKAIRDAIDAAEHMVVLMSPDANESKWVNIEVNYALGKGVKVWPVLIRGKRQEAVLFSLYDTQYEDAREDLSRACEKLIATLKKPADVSMPPDRASEPVQVEEEPEAEPEPEAELPTITPPQIVETHGARGPAPEPKPSPERSRNWIRITVVLIALAGTLAVAYAMVTRDPPGVSVPEKTATAEAVLAMNELPSDTPAATVTQIATATPTATPVPTEAPTKPAPGTEEEFGGIPFVYVLEGDFWIMQTEVTNATWQRFMDADGYSQESYWSDEGWQWRAENGITEPSEWDNSDFNRPDQPIVGVSWYDAEAFTNWLTEESGTTMRLPTDEEWELACAGPEERTYPWGDAPPLENLLNYDQNVGSAEDVGSFPDGASPYNALDMVGNAYEWSESGSLRGGSWFNKGELYVRCDTRSVIPLDLRFNSFGFRVLSPGS